MVIFFLFLLVGVSSWETIEIDSVYQELPYTELSDISINRKVKEGSWLIFFTDTVSQITKKKSFPSPFFPFFFKRILGLNTC